MFHRRYRAYKITGAQECFPGLFPGTCRLPEARGRMQLRLKAMVEIAAFVAGLSAIPQGRFTHHS